MDYDENECIYVFMFETRASVDAGVLFCCGLPAVLYAHITRIANGAVFVTIARHAAEGISHTAIRCG